jgi:hypothetical protein
LKCLSYDFAGTTIDEAGEDTGTIQVRKEKESKGTLTDFFF